MEGIVAQQAMRGRKKPDGKDPDGTKHVFGNAVGEDVDKPNDMREPVLRLDFVPSTARAVRRPSLLEPRPMTERM